MTIPVPSELGRANGGPVSSIPLVVKADEIHSEAKKNQLKIGLDSQQRFNVLLKCDHF